MRQLYEFTVLRFYRLFLVTLQYIDTLRLYAFTILPLYRLLLFTLSTKKHKFTALRFYFGFLRFHTSFTVLRFYGFTTFSCPRFAHKAWIYQFAAWLRFHAVNLVNR